MTLEQFLREMAGLVPYDQRTIKGGRARQEKALELLRTIQQRGKQ